MGVQKVAGSGSTVSGGEISMIWCYYLVLVMFSIDFVENLSVLICLEGYFRLYCDLGEINMVIFRDEGIYA